MEHLRWIGFGAFFASSLVVGVRLLLLARQTGKLPEFLIGIGVLGIGPFGYGLSMLAFVLASHSLALSATLMGSALLATQHRSDLPVSVRLDGLPPRRALGEGRDLDGDRAAARRLRRRSRGERTRESPAIRAPGSGSAP